MKRFWDTLVPRLPQLRALYRERNGSLVTFTLIRDPAAHILSTYRMWPPHLRVDGSKHVRPFQDWLPVASGLQAAPFFAYGSATVHATAFTTRMAAAYSTRAAAASRHSTWRGRWRA